MFKQPKTNWLGRKLDDERHPKIKMEISNLGSPLSLPKIENINHWYLSVMTKLIGDYWARTEGVNIFLLHFTVN